MGRVLDILASVACWVGGFVLLTLQSADSTSYSLTGHTVFEGIAHGVGLYCIGKGLFIARSSYYEGETAVATRKLVEFEALRHGRETLVDDDEAGPLE